MRYQITSKTIVFIFAFIVTLQIRCGNKIDDEFANNNAVAAICLNYEQGNKQCTVLFDTVEQLSLLNALDTASSRYMGNADWIIYFVSGNKVIRRFIILNKYEHSSVLSVLNNSIKCGKKTYLYKVKCNAALFERLMNSSHVNKDIFFQENRFQGYPKLTVKYEGLDSSCCVTSSKLEEYKYWQQFRSQKAKAIEHYIRNEYPDVIDFNMWNFTVQKKDILGNGKAYIRGRAEAIFPISVNWKYINRDMFHDIPGIEIEFIDSDDTMTVYYLSSVSDELKVNKKFSNRAGLYNVKKEM